MMCASTSAYIQHISAHNLHIVPFTCSMLKFGDKMHVLRVLTKKKKKENRRNKLNTNCKSQFWTCSLSKNANLTQYHL